MKFYSIVLISIVSFWVINCSAAQGDAEKKREIHIKKIGHGVSLGIVMSELSDEDKDEFKVKEGAKIINVIDNTEAEKIGLKSGDIILKFDGKDIKTAKQLNNIVESMDDEKKVQILVQRDGKSVSFDAQLKKSEDRVLSYAFSDDEDGNFNWHVNSGDGETMAWVGADGDEDIVIDKIENGMGIFGHGSGKGGFLGVDGKTLSKQLLNYFEVEFGVLIEKVLDDSPAKESGLMAGDIITHVEDREIKDFSDLVRTLNYYNPEETVEIQYVRKGSKKSTKVTLAKKSLQPIFIDEDGDKTIIKKFMDSKDLHHIREGLKGNFKDFKGMGNVLYII